MPRKTNPEIAAAVDAAMNGSALAHRPRKYVPPMHPRDSAQALLYTAYALQHEADRLFAVVKTHQKRAAEKIPFNQPVKTEA